MQSHDDFTDSDFERVFENASLDPGLFNHEAHLRLAWIHIKKYGVEKAVDQVTSQLKNFVGTFGFNDKYHETVTVAAVRAVNQFMIMSTRENFKDFIKENQRLKTNFKDLISQHYSKNIFNSDQARKNYLEPDLLPF